MSLDEDEARLWRDHLEHQDWPSLERWAAAAARAGNPWGRDFVRASLRYPRAVHRAQFRSAARHGTVRVAHLQEKARGFVHALRARGRKALRELRRLKRRPRNHGPIPEMLRGVHALLTDLLDEEGRRARSRARRLLETEDQRASRRMADRLDAALEHQRELNAQALVDDLRRAEIGPWAPDPDPRDDEEDGDPRDSHEVVADLLERCRSLSESEWAEEGRALAAFAETRVGRVRFRVFRRDGRFELEAWIVRPTTRNHCSLTTMIGEELPEVDGFDEVIQATVTALARVLWPEGEAGESRSRARARRRGPRRRTEA